MRALIVTLAILALPALAVAQQAPVQDTDMAVPTVELQQSTPAGVTAAPTAEADAPEQQKVESRKVVDDAAMQGDPTTTNWWWLVGAIVVGGLLLAALLR